MFRTSFSTNIFAGETLQVYTRALSGWKRIFSFPKFGVTTTHSTPLMAPVFFLSSPWRWYHLNSKTLWPSLCGPISQSLPSPVPAHSQKSTGATVFLFLVRSSGSMFYRRGTDEKTSQRYDCSYCPLLAKTAPISCTLPTLLSSGPQFINAGIAGIRGIAHDWFTSYLKERPQLVNVGIVNENISVYITRRLNSNTQSGWHRVKFYALFCLLYI